MIAKRVFDLACSGIGLIVLSPVLVAIAIAIRLDSTGPVFFRQVRVGRGSMPFRIHKFRTMHAAQHANVPQITIGRDPRITRVGHILRHTKLDELPQLLDVFLGKMSIVGPRPEVPRYVKHYPPALSNLIFRVRPGITDAASLNFINESELLACQKDPERYYIDHIIPIKNQYHVDYVNDMSLWRDITILFATIKRIVVRS